MDASALAHLRREFVGRALDESSAHADPIAFFGEWFDAAVAAQVPDANAMTLATVTAQGAPSARIVLLKAVEGGQFVFYTNYQSRKGTELSNNAHAALLFFWPQLNRQVRIEGVVARVDGAVADAYWASRPRGSQLGAWASAQSTSVASRIELEASLKECEARFAGKEIPRPAHWGGYSLAPAQIEFWQGRENRLHDRLVYRRGTEGWSRSRLSP